jgi:hypothetical protein
MAFSRLKNTLALVLLTVSPLAAQSWTAYPLRPAVATASFANSLDGTRQGGWAVIDDISHAYLWSGTPASALDLHPAAAFASSIESISATQQAGAVYIGDADHYRAALWTGTAASFVDLNPAGVDKSYAFATNGTQQAGSATTGSVVHAALWTGTAESFVDLNPAGSISSAVSAMNDTHQGGYACFADLDHAHAGIWSGTAASFVDLHPAAAMRSYIMGMAGDQQVGSVTIDDSVHAAVWTGTAASFVDFNPPGALASVLNATDGTRQVGHARLTAGAFNHAVIWMGAPGSYIDLHGFLPLYFSSSEARGVAMVNGSLQVAGLAFNTNTGRNEAILWKQSPPPAPQPRVKISGPKKVTATAGKYVIRGTATDAFGTLLRVEVKVGKQAGYRRAIGRESWKFTARLKPGKQVITARAIDAAGFKSPVATVTVHCPARR